MQPLKLSFIKEATNAEWHHSLALSSDKDLYCTGVAIDSRKVLPGDIFFALEGSNADGHEYLEDAKKRGAVAFVISKNIQPSLPCLIVKNTLKALGDLARSYRQQFSIPIVAITGSCGKTTVKEMLASILRVRGPVLSTEGNYNNEVGVPLTLLNLESHHHVAIIEMGARHPGDIAYLMSLAKPSASVITNAGVAHLEIFGTAKAIAMAKGEIYEQLGPQGTAVINRDESHFDYWTSLLQSSHSLVTFGLQDNSAVSAREIQLFPTSSHFKLTTSNTSTTVSEGVDIKLSIPGKHNISNALCAAAAATALKVGTSIIQEGLQNFTPVKGRSQLKKGLNGCTIIDDTYNANPVSVRAALDVLASFEGLKLFIMGDMFELGDNAEQLHAEIGAYAQSKGINQLLALGSLSNAAAKEFGSGAMHYENPEDLIASLLHADPKLITDKTTVLVKGSRGMKMERLVLALTGHNQEETSC